MSGVDDPGWWRVSGSPELPHEHPDLFPDLPGWPWADVPVGAQKLDWSATLTPPDAFITARVRYAVLTEAWLVILIGLEPPPGVEMPGLHSGRPMPKAAGSARFFLELPGGQRLESRGEWDYLDPAKSPTGESAVSEFFDSSAGRGGENISLTLRPPPGPGRLTLTVQWIDEGLAPTSISFEVAGDGSSRPAG
jgi:hypothetical protein